MVVPSRWILWCNLSGSAAFTTGSSFFVWSSWTTSEEWLILFQIGCAVWILGCVLFLLPFLVAVGPLLHLGWLERNNWNWCDCSIRKTCQVGSLIAFLVGCALAFGPESTVLHHLKHINWLFLVGSCLLLVERLCESLQRCNKATEQSTKPPLDQYIGWSVSLSYVVAGCFGGYGNSSNMIRVGMFGWVFGSVLGGMLPVIHLCSKSRTELDG